MKQKKENIITGKDILYKLIPEDLIAIISLSVDMRNMAVITAMKSAMGIM
jgi:hypothetical protein